MLATGVRRGERFFALGPSLGQCCGGSVTLAWRMLDESAFADWPAPVPLFHLQLHGAGHVGRAVATILSTIDCRVDWIDVRDDRFADSGRAWPDHVRPVTVDSPVAEVAGASRESFFLVMTHSHELDFELVEHILRRDAFGFLGLIGSQTKRARFARRLLDRGFTPAGIERLRCPVGDAGLASKAPELIAVGIVAELVRVADTLRHGAKVQGLQESRR
jgi:xanthine dehydrogenase accessory factor